MDSISVKGGFFFPLLYNTEVKDDVAIAYLIAVCVLLALIVTGLITMVWVVCRYCQRKKELEYKITKETTEQTRLNLQNQQSEQVRQDIAQRQELVALTELVKALKREAKTEDPKTLIKTTVVEFDKKQFGEIENQLNRLVRSIAEKYDKEQPNNV